MDSLRSMLSYAPMFTLLISISEFRPNQYHKYLVTKWKLRKNADSEIWRAISAKADEFEQAGMQYSVAIRGREVSAAKVRREINRYRPPSHAFRSQGTTISHSPLA